MRTFDYGLAASLVFTAECPNTKRSRGPIPFQLASNAIRYAVEVIDSASYDFMYLEAHGKHYDNVGIRCLYDNASYPLNRAAIT